MAKNKSISTLLKEDCVGCRSCGDVCPKRSISFAEDLEGFYYPIVDDYTCINCGLCSTVCPALSVQFNDRCDKSYAIYANDVKIRESGSSGGVFRLLAEIVLNDGGRIWGAAFNEELQLVHSKADNINELQPLLKSKYIQSNLTDVYAQIKKDLLNGVRTLFCGTPCQVNALKNFVGKEFDDLITIDFVCHGVPNQNLFDRTIRWYEEKHNVKVDWFQFRYKSKEVKHPQSYALHHLGENDIHVGLHYQFPYYFGFQKYIILRPSCYQCKWARGERAADITLGDYWGIEKYIPRLNAKDGVSMILCNTLKGNALLEKLKSENAVTVYVLSLQNAVDNNGCLCGPSSAKLEREQFFSHLQSWDFNRVVKEHLTPKKKWIFDLYYRIPKSIRGIIRKILNKRVRYE